MGNHHSVLDHFKYLVCHVLMYTVFSIFYDLSLLVQYSCPRKYNLLCVQGVEMYWKVNLHNLYLQNSLSSAPVGLNTLPKKPGFPLPSQRGGGMPLVLFKYSNQSGRFIWCRASLWWTIWATWHVTWTSSKLRKNICVLRIWLGFDNHCG